MTEQTSRASKWLSQHDPIPELSLGDFTKLMAEGFQLLTDTSPRGKSHVVRVSDRIPGYSEDFRSILVPSHHRNGVFISPLCIIQVLAKFEKSQDEFRRVYNRFFSSFHAA